MISPFDLDGIVTVEFGVGRESGGLRGFGLVPIDDELQDALKEMAKETFRQMEQVGTTPSAYDPADEPPTQDYQQLSLDDDLAASLREVFVTANFDYDQAFGDDLADVFCYFARFKDVNDRHLLCLRRAAQFKAMHTKKGRVAFWFSFGVSDTLQLFTGNLFQLNNDFDVAIDEELVHIIHPKSFKALAQIDRASTDAVTANLRRIREACPYVRWETIEEQAVGKPRIAALLASIRSAGHADNVDKSELVSLCHRAGVPVEDNDGVIVPDDKIVEFLQVLNRRRWESNLVPKEPEVYVASSRRRAPS